MKNQACASESESPKVFAGLNKAGSSLWRWLAVLFVFAFAPLHAAELRMDSAVCQQLVTHTPDADVAFQPGVGADGQAVAPADINPSPVNKILEHQIAIKLYNDAAQVFGLGVPSIPQPAPGGGTQKTPLTMAEMDVGYITLRNGTVYLNGNPLDNPQQEELAVLCIQREKR